MLAKGWLSRLLTMTTMVSLIWTIESELPIVAKLLNVAERIANKEDGDRQQNDRTYVRKYRYTARAAGCKNRNNDCNDSKQEHHYEKQDRRTNMTLAERPPRDPHSLNCANSFQVHRRYDKDPQEK